MIGFLRGKLVRKAPPILVMDVQGVGYELEAPMTTFYQLPQLGDEFFLHTHLVVREDAHSLFGFATEPDRALFRMLVKISGVGPKLALTILSGLNADEFHDCIRHNDSQTLTRLPGVGKKTAERLLVEMRGRLPEKGTTQSVSIRPDGTSSATTPSAKQEAISALCSLGYKPQDAAHMVQQHETDGKRCEDIIRLALQGAVR